MTPNTALQPTAPHRPTRAAKVIAVLWPAFVMAGVLVALIFVVVDPASLTWFGGEPLGWPRQAVYTVTFFICWAVIAVACALTSAMGQRPDGSAGHG